MYEFTIVDPDEPYGVINTFSSIDEAINFCVGEYRASEQKFEVGGMIQKKYLSYLKSKL